MGLTLDMAGKGLDVTVGNLSQVVLPDGGAMTPPNMGVPTPARRPDADVPTAPGTRGVLFVHTFFITFTIVFSPRKKA